MHKGACLDEYDVKNIQYIQINDVKLTAKLISKLKRINSLRFLDIYYGKYDKKILKLLSGVKNLKKLSALSVYTQEAYPLFDLSPLTQLNFLELNHISAADFSHIIKLPNLKRLSLSNCELTCQNLQELQKISRLENLSLGLFGKIPNLDFGKLNLKVLKIYCKKDISLETLLKCKYLKKLILDIRQPHETVFSNLKKLKELEYLYIRNYLKQDLENELHYLQALSHLKTLHLKVRYVNYNCLRYLKH